MKIFVSYSRKDAGDFAKQIHAYFTSFKYDIFTDTDNIKVGDFWNTTIEENISNCDIFVVIITYGALQSPHVNNEVLQAKKEKKKIIPCIHRSVVNNAIKWDLDQIQGVEFNEKEELARDLYAKIIQDQGALRIVPDTKNSQKINNWNTAETRYNHGIGFKNAQNSKNRNGLSHGDSQDRKKQINLKLVVICIIAAAGVLITIAVLASGNLLHLQYNDNSPITDSGDIETVNIPPIADAGVDQEVKPGTVVTLNGDNSKDPEGNPLKYFWTQTSGTPVVLNGKDKPTTSFTIPDAISIVTSYTFKLITTNEDGLTDDDFIKVTVKPLTTILNTNAERVNLVYSTVFIPEAVRLANLKSFTHSVTVWLNSTVPSLSNVKNVTYFAKEGYTTLASGQADSFSQADKFRVSFNALDGFPLYAKIYFKDGQQQNLSTNIVLR